MKSQSKKVGLFGNPEMLVGLSALLLSICGLGIAIYEASLYREAQRASVWPHVEVSASLTNSSVRLWIQNTGVGPARIRAGAVTYEGERLGDWSELLVEVGGDSLRGFGNYYRSIFNGRVLPSSSDQETIFQITPEYAPPTDNVILQLGQSIVDGSTDMSMCYCSVYDDCWTASLQDMLRRSRGDAQPIETQEVGSCASAPRSAI